MRQHAEMVDAYRDAGVNVHFLEPDPALPYQVYARDSSFMTPHGAVVTQMHQWWRRGEYAPVIRFYQEAGIPIWRMITASAFEGGDFDVIEPGCVLIGYCGERTQEPAARQVAEWVSAEGWEVRLQPIDEHYVHIDLMVCMLAPKLAAVCPDTTDDAVVEWLRGKGIELVPVSYRDTMELGCNVVALGNDRVISTSESTDLNARLRALGFTVYDPDVTSSCSAAAACTACASRCAATPRKSATPRRDAPHVRDATPRRGGRWGNVAAADIERPTQLGAIREIHRAHEVRIADARLMRRARVAIADRSVRKGDVAALVERCGGQLVREKEEATIVVAAPEAGVGRKRGRAGPASASSTRPGCGSS